MNAIDTRILQIMQDGITRRREPLAAFLGIHERTLRNHFCILRKAGYKIIPQPGGGYAMTDDRKAVADFSAALRNRGTDMIETAAALTTE